MRKKETWKPKRKRRLRQGLGFVLSAAMVMGLSGGSILTAYAAGDGEDTLTALSDGYEVELDQDEDGYYLIYDENDILSYAEMLENGYADSSARLAEDITVSADTGFAGFGTSDIPYAGTFDGNGHTVTLSISTDRAAGLFAYVSGATIEDVTTAGTVTTTGSFYYGCAGLVSYVKSGGVIIRGCVNKADVSGTYYVAGLVGSCSGDSGTSISVTIEDSFNEGSITSTNIYAGGIAAYVYNGSISGCINYGAVSGNDYTGGIVGYAYSYGTLEISDCGNEGTITGSSYTGGIVGESKARSSASLTLDGLYNAGTVSGINHVGGIIGRTYASLSNTYNVGTVSGSSSGSTGGLIGSNQKKSTVLSNAYNAGEVSRRDGLLVGTINNSNYLMYVDNAYYLSTLDGSAIASGSSYFYSYSTQAAITDDELAAMAKTSDMLTALAGTLGGSFITNTDTDYHMGYPVLVWEVVEGLTYSVNMSLTGISSDGDAIVVVGSDYTATLTADAYYALPESITVTVGGSELESGEGYAYDTESGTLTIYAAYITGDIEITAAGILSISTNLSQDEDGYYLLYTEGNILAFADLVVNATTDLNARLMADITVSADSGFAGIGTADAPYAGTFDGNGCTVTLSMSTDGAAGLFAYVSGATIEDVTTAGTVASSVNTYGCAGLVSYVMADGVTIRNCVNKADVSGAGYVAGLVGRYGDTYASYTIADSSNEGSITSTGSYAGGIVAYFNVGIISGCVNYGAVSGTIYTGGIAGYAYSRSTLEISDCGNEGTVTGSSNCTGGIVGFAYYGGTSSQIMTLDGLYNAGTVSGTTYVGGIIGKVCANLSNAYNAGTVSGTDVSTGGLVGNNEQKDTVLSNVYNAGEVTYTSSGVTYAGGLLVGTISSSSYLMYVDNAYYLSTQDGSTVAAGSDYLYSYSTQEALTEDEFAAMAKTSSELQDLSGTLGDSFKENLVDTYHGGYPILSWEDNGDDPDAARYAVAFTLTGLSSDGASRAAVGSDYTTTLTADEYYALPENITVTVGGSELVSGEGYTYDAESGSLTIYASYITGDIEITAVGIAPYSVSTTLTGLSSNGSSKAVVGTDYTTTLTAKAYYVLPESITVTVGGSELESGEGYAYDTESGILTIYAAYITGDIEITAVGILSISTDLSRDEDGYYLLYTESDIFAFAVLVATSTTDLNARLMADITVTADSGFAGIGTADAPYAGTFDGNGHTVTLSMSTDGAAGLFAYVSGATIKDVTTAGTVASSVDTYGCAGLVSYVMSGGVTITNCVNMADVSGTGYVAGLVGRCSASSVSVSVTDCANEGTVSGQNYTGGIAAQVYAGSISGSINTGTVSGSGYTGGIIGDAYASGTLAISNCGNDGDVTGSGSYTGGIAGRAYRTGSVTLTLDGLYNIGAVSGTTYTGGIAGQTYASLSNVYNQGTVSGTDVSTGGIAGNNYYKGTVLSNAYNSGQSTYTSGSSTKSAGILVGSITSSSYIMYVDNVYYYSALNGDPLVTSGSSYLYSRSTGAAVSNDEYEEEMLKQASALKALASTLGSSFVENTDTGYHQAYPVLAWETTKTYPVSFSLQGLSCDGASRADVWSDYTATLSAVNQYFTLPDSIAVTADGTELVSGEGYTYDAQSGALTIDAAFVTGDISITAAGVLSINTDLTQDEDGYYLLYTESDILDFAALVAMIEYPTPDLDARLMADVTISADSGFAGIGTSSAPYAATFDGNGCTVTLSLSTDGAAGLFAYVSGATIEDVTTAGTVASSVNTYGCAGLVSYVMTNGVTIRNCVNQADVSGAGYVAGLVGRCSGSSVSVMVADSSNEGSITATGGYAGGIAAYVYNGSISGCVNYGAVSGTTYKGGIAGYAYSYSTLEISDCGNESAVTGSGNYTGGIVGNAHGSSSQIMTLDGLYNAGTVSGTTCVGGITGRSYASLSNAYNAGTVSGTAVSTGGLIGNNFLKSTVLSNAYNAGEVTYTSSDVTYAGGLLVGSITSSSYLMYVDNVYYLSTLDGSAIASGSDYLYSYSTQAALTDDEIAAMAKTSAELTALAETLGDSFVTNTDSDYHLGYPVLAWEETGDDVEELRIITQPEDYTATAGSTAVFEVEATGSGLTYQWQYLNAGASTWRDSGMSGADTASISVPATEARDGQQYRCVVTDGDGNTVTSDAATLTVSDDAGFSITLQPSDYTGLAGTTATFTVEADGTGLTYQWQYLSAGGTMWHDSGLATATTATLSVTMTEARDGQQYRCIVTDENGDSVISDTAALSLPSAGSIVITTQPSDCAGAAGDTATFTVEATGNGLTYQWQYLNAGASTWRDSGMDGADTAAVSVPITEARDGQQYRCVVTDEDGNMAVSDAVTLSVE